MLNLLNGLVSPNYLVIRSSACTTDSIQSGSEANGTCTGVLCTRGEMGITDALQSLPGFLSPGGIFLGQRFQVQSLMKI